MLNISASTILLIIIGIIVFIVIYFLPSIVAREKQHFSGIFLLNLFLGWTFLGWLGSLIWAATSPSKEEANRLIRLQNEHNNLLKEMLKKSDNVNTLNQNKNLPPVFEAKKNDIVTENKSIPPPFENKKNEPLKRNKPTLAEWRKENPMRSINDYYAKFGT